MFQQIQSQMVDDPEEEADRDQYMTLRNCIIKRLRQQIKK